MMAFDLLKKEVSQRLNILGYSLDLEIETGLIYFSQDASICLMVDISICECSQYPYVSYTTEQNNLVHCYDLFLRFSINSIDDLDRLEYELLFFTGDEPEPEKLRQYGANRHEQEIDPTLPEATFEECFAQAFGEHSLYALSREEIYYDYDGKRRFIDYVLITSIQKFAIELNGEAFHHPVAIKEKRYQSQLFKQNSLAAQGYKVFRWSQRGMADKEKFIQQINQFFGHGVNFASTPQFKALRSLQTFQLAEHQHDALQYLNNLRDEGRNTFIIILPTATGKTEIFIEDLYQQQLKPSKHKALVLVPSKHLKQQTVDRFNKRYKKLEIDENFFSVIDKHICVQTFAYFLRHYHELSIKTFDYIVVDEAHHAQATGLKKALEYYKPQNLLGFTATDERLDQKRLEDIFGQYKTQMTLKEAIEKGIVPPISVFRLETNIDLSHVRFNGKDFVKSDLQATIQIPSRDEMIVRLMKKHFSKPVTKGASLKQGVIFCVDIKHAKRIAVLFKEIGLTACAVSGIDRKKSDAALAAYAKEEIQFLCACDLLNEGWDSPQTSILVMARPTLSKVLYMQQLGRGTRHHKGKERLYVIDVVDSYGAQLQPWSVHGALGLKEYRPFGDIMGENIGSLNDELIVLSGLYEQVVQLIPIDVFTMQEELAGMLSVEQLARELFVSTGTVKNWIKKDDITPDAIIPFGNNFLYYFLNESISTIRQLKKLSVHTEKTRKDDFFNFLKERDYTFSYKIIFLCLMFRLANKRGEVDLEILRKAYSSFYMQLLNKFQKAEKEKSSLNRIKMLEDMPQIQRSILQNPFEKFERKRFMHHCKDLKYISFDSVLWNQFVAKDKASVQNQMFDDLDKYYQSMDMIISKSIKSEISFIEEREQETTTRFTEPNEKQTNIAYLAFYPLEIAAGGFAESQLIDEPDQWINVEGLPIKQSLTDELFISQVHGQSMEPLIPDGSFCLFRYGVTGSRNGRVVLVKKDGILDKELQTSFTIKRYYSEKIQNDEFGWIHEKIELRPDNSSFSILNIDLDGADNFSVIAEFVQVIDLD